MNVWTIFINFLHFMLLGTSPSEKTMSLVFVDPRVTCSAFLIMFQRWWLKSWFSSWLMSYNWAGYLLLVSDERSPLIHSWSATFDGARFNLRDASPKLILKFKFTDEVTRQSWKNSCLSSFSIPQCNHFGEVKFSMPNPASKLRRAWMWTSQSSRTGGILCHGRELSGDLCGQVTPERSYESNILWQLKIQFLH